MPRGMNNYNSTQVYTDKRKLPAGAYEIEIRHAEDRDDTLCILFDIADGEYKGYFMDKFAEDKKYYSADAKYKGVYRLWYENDRNDDERNERNRRRMKTELEKIKESNRLNIDFAHEWDGAALKGCRVGMIFRDEEYDYNGYQGYAAKPYGLVTLENLKEGKFTLPSPKALSGAGSGSSFGTAHAAEQPALLDDDLPF